MSDYYADIRHKVGPHMRLLSPRRDGGSPSASRRGATHQRRITRGALLPR